MHRRTFLLAAPALALTGCGAAEPVWAPDAFVAANTYVHPGPPMLTLFTMKNTGSDNGAHTGLMINASQRVIFDPAGTFGHETIPERNDVHFGITPRVEEYYQTYHARMTYYLLRQDLQVSPATAEAALRGVMAYGAVPKAKCTIATSEILGTLPELGGIRTVLFPDKLSDQFGRIPGVVESVRRENDSDDKSLAEQAYTEQLQAAAATGG
ncbi:hypothetical protein OG2516_16691 [Oceanicola granulosus HTCC2516]|uniref:Lipoprotein n=1 Tax=Oceanicola granulosus (strain ATCC BAA-861 / DSM 15982 / KCTC 12143 / HTCC2516) TaxID=314256 RepID=Q2CCE5_OCEGH|nr:hypothetical protein [Oceanicola granulosus]EAR50373.1 hypothetical protein OG2516_16691 [Oceanicola granulosus HTCC2516]